MKKLINKITEQISIDSSYFNAGHAYRIETSPARFSFPFILSFLNNYPLKFSPLFILPETEITKIWQLRALLSELNLATDQIRRLVVITAADTMNLESQQTLLKSCEEPGENTEFLLVTTDPSGLISPLKSRTINLNHHFSEDIYAIITDLFQKYDSEPAEFIRQIFSGLSTHELTISEVNLLTELFPWRHYSTARNDLKSLIKSRSGLPQLIDFSKQLLQILDQEFKIISETALECLSQLSYGEFWLVTDKVYAATSAAGKISEVKLSGDSVSLNNELAGATPMWKFPLRNFENLFYQLLTSLISDSDLAGGFEFIYNNDDQTDYQINFTQIKDLIFGQNIPRDLKIYIGMTRLWTISNP